MNYHRKVVGKYILKNNLKKRAGFTVIELLAVVALIAIFTSISAPSYNKFIEQGRFSQAANDLYNAYRFARAEAIKTSSTMTLQPKADDWANGWQVTSDGAVLLDVKAPHESINIAGSAVTVLGRGSVSIEGPTASFTIASTQHAIDICILRSGQSHKKACA